MDRLVPPGGPAGAGRQEGGPAERGRLPMG